MTSPNPTNESDNRVAPAPGNRPGLYLVLLIAQTAGVVIVLINALPIYRQMVGDFSKHQPQPGIMWWAVAAVALIQSAYWVRVRLRPPLPCGSHIVAGHIAAFVARLSFIFASSSFSVMFLVHLEQLSLPPHRVLMLLALLFSMFCWTLELERLARALHRTDS